MISDYQNIGIPPNYLEILNAIKEKQGKLFWNVNRPEESNYKEAAVTVIRKYLLENRVTFENWSSEDISERLYNDIFERSVLTAPLKDVWVSKITINPWNVLTVQFTNGKCIQADGFPSPHRAKEVICEMLHCADIDGKESAISCKATGELRITAFFPPVVSNDTGVYCCIQKLSQRRFTAQDYTANDFAIKKELDFLVTALRFGISVLIVGKHGSGKTALMNYLLSKFEDATNVVSIDQYGDEIQYGTLLRPTENVDAKSLIHHITNYNPDLIACNLDQCLVQPASLKGYPVLATTEADDPFTGLILAAQSWWSNQSVLGLNAAFKATCQAFPIIVTLHSYPDHKIRIADISEYHVNEDNFNLQTLWYFLTKECSAQTVRGRHVHCSNISLKLADHMRLCGASQEEIEKYTVEE